MEGPHHKPDRLSYRLGTAAQFRWVKVVVQITLVLNAIDAVLTMFWITSGMATEGNPILKLLAHEHPIAFVSSKLGLVSLGSLLLWRLRKHGGAVVGIFLVFLVYYYLLLYHLSAMNINLLDRLSY